MPVRYTIKHMQQFAREYGGKCLSKDYINDDGRLKWMCHKGHTWDASYTIIRQGGWCRQCVLNKDKGEKLEELQRIAKKKGGKCLSKAYTNINTKLEWECGQGHRWMATPHIIRLNNSWCPYCSGNAPRTIKDMQKKAAERGGKCLSHKYSGSQVKLWWQCKREHTWQAKPDSIFAGRWCGKCAFAKQSERQKTDIAVYQRLAEKKGGRLLSKKYENNSAHMEWICGKGHTWHAGGAHILNGSWCPFCARKAKLTIEEMQEAAKRKRGKCLSRTYTNNTTKLVWQCAQGHQWKAAPTDVINNGTWCPACAREILKYNLPQYKKIKNQMQQRLRRSLSL